MTQDRGTIKWTSLMLPEHVELLKKMWKEDRKKIKPLLDSQEIEWINQQIMESYENQLLIQLAFFENSQTHHIVGKISELHPKTKKINIETEDHERVELLFSAILSVSFQ